MPTDTTGFGQLVADVARSMRQGFEQNLKHQRLTVTQTRALLCISNNPGCRQVDLARMLGFKASSLGNMLDQLEHAGLVRREPTPSDRRAFRLYLEDHADEELTLIASASEKIRNAALFNLSPAQTDSLMIALQQIQANLENLPAR
ncbi:MarR family winged helix-turn-helix transcriptional regulator [Pseudomonas bharatica]|uniref:MarR family winged helix-turn-helix transcriptional regulator n=1 Tax=Pseudomonas bharatica TaxID=2692112 RepID=UPI003B27B5D0